MITHVQNVQKALGTQGGCEIEVVFYGPGLNMLKRPNRYEAALRELTEAGVTLAACQNAMRVMKLTSADLFDFATEVDSGISELIRKQTAGWAYIH